MTQLSTLIESEIADFFAGFGGPGEPDIQSGEAQRLLTDRINRLLAAEAREPVAINDDMAYAFHHALSDGALGADEVEEIKTGLRAAFANVAAPQPVAVPMDYAQGEQDGREWAAQMAEANHPQTGDWLYDDPLELAKAIRKGPDMPKSRPAIAYHGDNFYSWFGRFWIENYQQNNYTTSAKQMLSTMAEFAYRAGRDSATQAANSPVTHAWIQCSERMPEAGDVVLTAKDGYMNVGEMERSGAHCRYFTSVASGRELPADYWMPLPAAPQEPTK